MTESEKIWLKTTFTEEYFSTKAVMNGNTLSAYYEAERILEGNKQITKRDCNCSLGSLRQSVNVQLKKFLEYELQRGVLNK